MPSGVISGGKTQIRARLGLLILGAILLGGGPLPPQASADAPAARLLWRQARRIPGLDSLARQAVVNTQWSLWKRFTPGEDLPALLARLSPAELPRALRVPEVRGITEAMERARLRIRGGAEARAAVEAELSPLASAHLERVRFIRAREALPVDTRETFLAGAGAGIHTFVAGEYRDIRDLALEILGRFPPARFHYLGIGRSPTPLIAFLEELQGVRASTIPFALAPGSPPAAAEVDTHLARFLPREEAGRRLLAIDLTASGRTLIEFEAALRRAGARGARVLALAEAVPARDGAGTMAVDWTLATREGAPIELIPLDRYPVLNRRLKASAYDDVAAFETHRVGAAVDPIPGGGYDAFRTLLRQRMEADTAVSGNLR